jgi:arylsulfatase A-like enzyme
MSGLGLAAGAQPSYAPPTHKKPNIIQIVVDTWGAHWLGCYGNTEIRTPHVDALARKSALFLDAYPEALPTLPARRSIYTGRRIFPSQLIAQPDDQVKIRGWHQLYAEDITISETLRAAGYTTAFVSDVYHQFKPGKNFNRGFDSWTYIRGQEGDRWVTAPRMPIDLTRYMHPSQKVQPHAKTGPMQYLLNRRSWKTQDDWLAAQVFREATQWVEDNHTENQPFFLHIESFSPHEHWDPPEDYYRLYMKQNYRGPWLLAPPQTTAGMSPLEVAHLRALYRGLVTFTDACLGKFLNKVESLGLMKNTIILFIADHGTMMGEQNQLHKGETRLRTQVTQVPLILYHPDSQWAGRRLSGFVQHEDIMPTLLDLAGVGLPSRVTGRSLQPMLESGRAAGRDQVIIGWGEHASIRTPEWCYVGRWSAGKPFEELYDVKNDPKELTNVASRHPRILERFRAALKTHTDSGWATTKGTFATEL